MPYFVKCFRYVLEWCRTVLLVFKSFISLLNNSMHLLCCGVPLSEAELMSWYNSVIFNHLEEPFFTKH
jgi:hypothetical protein